jgi:hypothetical protein
VTLGLTPVLCDQLEALEGDAGDRFLAFMDDTRAGVHAEDARGLDAGGEPGLAAEVRRAAEYIDLDKLVVSSDCGFGRQGLGRYHAFYKAAAIAMGANIVRREHGLPESWVPVADELLAVDKVPATYVG